MAQFYDMARDYFGKQWFFLNVRESYICKLTTLTRVFGFLLPTDRVFDPSCETQNVYDEGAKDVALSALTGINGW